MENEEKNDKVDEGSEEKANDNDKVDEEERVEENEEILSSDESEEQDANSEEEEGEDSGEEESEQENSETSQSQANGNKYFFRFVAITAILLFAIVLFKFSPDASFATSNVIAGGLSAKAAAADSQASSPSDQVATTNSDGVQVVKMYVQNGQYIMEPNSVKAGSKVRIEADVSRIPGCAKSIMIPAFNIRKSLTPSNNVIEFTPNKAGTFNIACSMNMYKGTFTVLESDGRKANYVEKANTAAPSCGGGSGGCGGCGG